MTAPTVPELLAECRAMLRQLLEAQAANSAHAVRRAEAAKLMGVSRTKLEALIRDGKVRTAVDVHLVPMSEVRRYCAPRQPRKAPKRYDRVPDARDEARLVRDALGGRK